MTSIIAKIQNTGMEVAAKKMEVAEWANFWNCTTMLPSAASSEQKICSDADFFGIGRTPKRLS